jgi:hypothetical protein
MKNEADPKAVPLSIQANGRLSSNPSSVYLQQPLIRLFTATLNLPRHPNGPSFFWVGFFSGC